MKNMPKSQLLIGLETSFKTDRKLRMSTCTSHKQLTSGVTPSPILYSLYTCENVDNYGWHLIQFLYKYITQQNKPFSVSTSMNTNSNSNCFIAL